MQVDNTLCLSRKMRGLRRHRIKNGGGVKQGTTWGETDEIGYYPINGKVSVHDVQATILNQLGFDHEKLTYQFQGRPFRLTDVSGKVISEILT